MQLDASTIADLVYLYKDYTTNNNKEHFYSILKESLC